MEGKVKGGNRARARYGIIKGGNKVAIGVAKYKLTRDIRVSLSKGNHFCALK